MQKFITRLSLSVFGLFVLVSSVNAATLCTMEYAPVCGQPKSTCNSAVSYCTDVMPTPQTYGNSCMLSAAGATFLYSGECLTGGMVMTRPLAKIDLTDAGAPAIGNSSELKFTCSASSYMSVSRTYGAYQGEVYIYNADTAGAASFSKVIQVDLGATYKLYCGDNNGNQSTASYSTPDYLKPQVRLSNTPIANSSTGAVLHTLSLQVINGPLKECNIFVNGVLKQTLAAGVTSVAMSFSGATSTVYASCKYSNNSVAIGSIDSNTIYIAPTSSSVTNSGCTKEYAPVCGRPSSCNSASGYCTAVLQKAQTYSNSCMLKEAGATFLYSGACTDDTPVVPSVTVCPAKGMFSNANCVCPNGQSPIVVPSNTDRMDIYTCDTLSVSCTADYAPVCARARNSCDGLTGADATACRPAPAVLTTYSNRCEMNKASAVYMYDGACDIATTQKIVTLKSSSGFTSGKVLPNSSSVKIGSFVLTNNLTSAIRLDGGVSVNLSGSTLAASNQMSNLTLKIDNAMVALPMGQPTVGVNRFYTSNIILQSGTSKTLDVYVDIGPGSANLSVTPVLGVYYTSTANDLDIPEIFATGVTTTVLDSNSATTSVSFIPDNSSPYVLGGTSGFLIGTLNVKSNIGAPITIRDISFSSPLNTLSAGNVNGKYFTFIGGKATVYGVNINLPAGTTGVNIPVKVDVSCVGTLMGCSINSPTTTNLEVASISTLIGGTSQMATVSNAKTKNFYIVDVLPSNLCPTGSFTSSSCVCPNGGTPMPIAITGSMPGSVLYSCSGVATSTPASKYCPTGTFSDIDCKCPLGTSMQTVNTSTCNGLALMCAQVMAYSCVAIPNYETPPYVPEIPINPTTPTICIEPTVNVGVGSRGTAVTDIQKFLNSNGYLASTPTGYFGSATRAAVIKFQSENGINSTGYVGQLTRAQLKVKSCEQPVPLPMPQPYTPLETSAVSVPSNTASVTTTNVMASSSSSSVISSLNVVAVAPGFSVSSVNVENGNKFTIVFKALDLDFDSPHYVKLVYKNSSKSCVLTASFIPVAGKTYNLIRSAESSCILGGVIGALSEIDHIEIVRQ